MLHEQQVDGHAAATITHTPLRYRSARINSTDEITDKICSSVCHENSSFESRARNPPSYTHFSAQVEAEEDDCPELESGSESSDSDDEWDLPPRNRVRASPARNREVVGPGLRVHQPLFEASGRDVVQQVTSQSAPDEAGDAEFDMVVSLGPPPSSRAFRVLGLSDLERRLLQSAYTYAITNFCMARGHDDTRGGHTDRLLFVIDSGCT